ncbi:hypothetical protein [Streptomyces lunaelactis]|uniref:hypothetical protein n=1 Tax=Streptomyces lunaelactis TaxID=1535768 RepID=UPI001584F3F6|nr:hypothetical protein [Streptomyces lunaelactis]NUL14488.1 hypothetical protein [Streptomyces lunaelactis]
MTQPAAWPCAATTCTRELRQHELETGQQLCDPCLNDMRRWLSELPNQLVVLVASAQRETTGNPTRGGTRTPPLPGRLDTLNLLGPAAPGTVHDPYGDQHGDAPIASILGAWVRIVIEERRLNGPKTWTIPTLAAWLAPHLDWAATQQWAGELRDELWSMTRAIRGITRIRPQTRPISRPCPRELCASLALTETDGDQYIRCGACGYSYTQQELNDDAARRAATAA